jgi:hypothetical protein
MNNNLKTTSLKFILFGFGISTAILSSPGYSTEVLEINDGGKLILGAGAWTNTIQSESSKRDNTNTGTLCPVNGQNVDLTGLVNAFYGILTTSASSTLSVSGDPLYAKCVVGDPSWASPGTLRPNGSNQNFGGFNASNETIVIHQNGILDLTAQTIKLMAAKTIKLYEAASTSNAPLIKFKLRSGLGTDPAVSITSGTITSDQTGGRIDPDKHFSVDFTGLPTTLIDGQSYTYQLASMTTPMASLGTSTGAWALDPSGYWDNKALSLSGNTLQVSGRYIAVPYSFFQTSVPTNHYLAWSNVVSAGVTDLTIRQGKTFLVPPSLTLAANYDLTIPAATIFDATTNPITIGSVGSSQSFSIHGDLATGSPLGSGNFKGAIIFGNTNSTLIFNGKQSMLATTTDFSVQSTSGNGKIEIGDGVNAAVEALKQPTFNGKVSQITVKSGSNLTLSK